MVDRSRRLRFSFDGKAYDGFAGDTLASALLANGVRLVGRSFKYHRPRGILSAGPEEPNALVELRTGARREPNIAATTVELHDGLEAASQNRRLSLRFDPLALVGPFASFMTAGFYYKTFMWPRSFWEKFYEPLIRRAAGLGRAAGEDDPDHYEKAIAFCDVLVIGGGPAGLAAALAAGRTGARVILCESDFALGGRLLAERTEIDGRPAVDWLRDAEAELKNLPEVRVMRRTTVFGVYDHGTYGALERVSDHLPVPPRSSPASTRLAHRRQARRACRGGDRAADRVRRQRPAGRHARGRGADLSPSVWRRSGTAGRRLHGLRRRLADGERSCRRRRAGDGGRCAARGRPGAGGAPRTCGSSSAAG